MKATAPIFIFPKVSFVEKLLFTKHLSVMIKSGIIISEALETLITQMKSKYFRFVLESVAKDVQNGQTLASAFSRYPAVFSQFYISLIEVGEESGTLESTLEFLSRQLAKEYQLTKKIQGAMFYPMLIFVAVTGMGGFISLFILPQLVSFFSSFSIELPLPTRILLFIANIMKSHGILIISLFIAGVTGFSFLVKTRYVKPFWHRFIITIPIFGEFLRNTALSRFSRNLGTMMASGVPLTRSLEVTAHTIDNLVYRHVLIDAREHVVQGRQLAKSIEDAQMQQTFISVTLFPQLVTKMIAVGEKTGKLEEVLLYLSEFYDEEIDNFTKNISSILEPMLLIGIGLVVGFVALAIIGPIYELTGSMG